MEYQVALAPDLEISPEAFVAAWNESPHRPEGTEARLVPATTEQYEPITVTIVITVITKVTADLLGDAIKTTVKNTVARLRGRGGGSDGEGGGQRISSSEIEQPDGQRVLVVTVEEH